jgi:hypothetical protein
VKRSLDGQEGRREWLCHIDPALQALPEESAFALSTEMPRCSLRQFININSRNKTVAPKSPVANQWRLAFHAVLTVSSEI